MSHGIHVDGCGPSGFMRACADASAHWPPGTVHFEHFKAPDPVPGVVLAEPGDFDMQVASTGQTARVRPEQSIVDALGEIGGTIETSCRSGPCGSCTVRYLVGDVEHHDCILDDRERGEFMTACVSRARSALRVLDL